jgi:hypothetical protein
MRVLMGALLVLAIAGYVEGALPTGDDSEAPGKIAFISDRDGNADIFVMEADGSNPTNLTNHEAEDIVPVWLLF